MIDEKLVTDFLATFELKIWWMFLKLFLATIVLISLKNKANSIVEYFIFISNILS